MDGNDVWAKTNKAVNECDNTPDRVCWEISNDILSIDENEFPYFVFKNTPCDDSVERWFEKYDEESDYVSCAMSENSDNFYAEFVFFKDGKIDKFVSNKEYQFKS